MVAKPWAKAHLRLERALRPLWHVTGPHFRDYHLLLDEQAASALASIDLLAERVRRIGGTTIRSIGHVSRLQTIEDDDNELVAANQMLQRLLDDNRQIAEKQRAAIEVCDEHGDTPTGNVLQEILDETEKRIWFVFEASRTGREAAEER